MRRHMFLLIAAVAGVVVVVVVVLAADPQPSSTVRTQAVDSQPADGSSSPAIVDSPTDRSGEVTQTPTTGEVTQTPTTGEVTQIPTSGEVTQTPTTAPVPRSSEQSDSAKTTTPTTTTTATLSPEQSPTSLPEEPVAVELVADTDTDSEPPTKGGDTEPSAEGRVYVWRDADRIRTVRLQSDLTIRTSSDGVTAQIVARSSVAGASSGEQALPVFRSESNGTMMTLPGGVLVLFDAEWDDAQTSGFFAEQGISKSLISPMLLDNAYKIETEPGFPSLDLANRLATLDGVVISSPNWTSEAVAK